VDLSLEAKIMSALGPDGRFTVGQLSNRLHIDSTPMLRTLQYMYGKEQVDCVRDPEGEVVNGVPVPRIVWFSKKKGSKPNELRPIGKPAPEPAPVKEIIPYTYGLGHTIKPVCPKGRMTAEDRSAAIRAGQQRRRERLEAEEAKATEPKKEIVGKTEPAGQIVIKPVAVIMEDEVDHHIPTPRVVQANEVDKRKVIRHFVPEISTELIFDSIRIFVGIPGANDNVVVGEGVGEVFIPIEHIDALCLQLKELKFLHAQITPRK